MHFAIICLRQLVLVGSSSFYRDKFDAGASSVFANSYLNDLTTEDNRDRVSSWGFGIGYLGGFITLIIGALILFNAPRLRISTEYAVRICFLFAGLWWGGFAVITFALLKPRPPVRDLPASRGYISASFGELRDTFRELFKLKQTLRFLVAYLLYNDGIQTVIAMSAVFLSQELFVAHGLDPDRTVLIFAFMITQAIGFVGALLFERVSHYTSAKTSIIITLIIWSGIVIYAYGFLQTVTEAYIMSGFIGLVLGGSQALSRSLFSQMIPAGRESAFLGSMPYRNAALHGLGRSFFGLVRSLQTHIGRQYFAHCILCCRHYYLVFCRHGPRNSRSWQCHPRRGGARYGIIARFGAWCGARPPGWSRWATWCPALSGHWRRPDGMPGHSVSFKALPADGVCP